MSEPDDWGDLQVIDRVAVNWDLVNTPAEVDLSSYSLSDLADLANSEHRLALSSAEAAERFLSAGVLHGIRAGEALLEAKKRHGATGWTAWVEDNTELSRSAARNYQRWAFYKEDLFSATIPLTYKSAILFLKDKPQVPGARAPKVTDADIAEMKRLYKEGHSERKIAEMVGCSRGQVWYHIVPGAKAKAKARARVNAKNQRLAKKALERENRAAAAKRAGGDLSKAYSLLRQLESALDSALGDATTDRDDLRLALSYAHKAEDHLSAAIRKRQ